MATKGTWGCWTCGSDDGRVTTTARDEDGNRIRRRRCSACGGIWFTEESRLARGTRFWQRANSQIHRQRIYRTRAPRPCRWCRVEYRGRWATHLAGPNHKAWKAERVKAKQEYNRLDSLWRYRNDPVFRQNQIDKNSRRKAKIPVRAQTAGRHVDPRLPVPSQLLLPNERGKP